MQGTKGKHEDGLGTRRLAGLVSIIQGLLIFVPTIVLGQAINWPDSLDDPASIALPRILQEESAVRFGYIAYLVYSILFVIAVFLIARLNKGPSMQDLFTIILAFAIASTLARTIGIVRWLVPMPELAESWESATSEQERNSISVVFKALNDYGGTIGEILGVSIFAAISVLILNYAFLKDRMMPTWLIVFGFLAAISLLTTTVELAGIDPGILIVAGTTMIQLWFLTVGIWLLVKSGKSNRNQIVN